MNSSRLRKFIIVVVTVFIVLMSKTVYFGIENKSTYQWVFCGLCLVGVVICKVNGNNLKNKIISLMPFLILFLFNGILYWGAMSTNRQNELIGYVLTFAMVALATTYIDRVDFSLYYIATVTIFAIISLLCNIIANTNESLALSFCQPGYDWTVYLGYSWFYTWGWNGTIFSRNSGPFWEPGAFQGFVLLAITMLVYESDNGKIKDKHRKWIFIVLMITMLTTQSTTGYILTILLVVTQGAKISNLISGIPKWLRNILIIAIAIFIVFYVIQSGNISDKLAGETNGSTEIRFSDWTGGLKMIRENPLFGIGLTNTMEYIRKINGVSQNDSIGLLSMAYFWGIPFAGYYIYRFRKGIHAFFEDATTVQMVSLYIIFIVLHCTEGLWFLPVHLYFTFCESESKTAMNVKDYAAINRK